MNRILFLCTICLLLLSPNNILSQQSINIKPINEKTQYEKYTKRLPVIDKIELYKISKDLHSNEYIGDSISNPNVIKFKSGLKEVKVSVTLTNEKAEEIAALWRRIEPGNGAGCFAPGFVIRFFVKDELFLESEVCFHCCNIVLPSLGIVSMCGNSKTYDLLKDKFNTAILGNQ